MKRHLGIAAKEGERVIERCPTCGEELETLLDNNGQNPWRTCWKCAKEAQDRDLEMAEFESLRQGKFE